MTEVRAYSTEHGLDNRFEFIEVPDGPHSGASNYPTASRFLFRDLRQ